MSKPLGLYVHLPFCQRKCAYCDFPSYAGRLEAREAYTDRVCGEIAARAEEWGRLEADTVYLGGGTPTMMELSHLKRILRQLGECFRIRGDAEISCEANPGTLRDGFLETLRENGVSRLSVGAQSADEAELRLLGRIHSWEQAEETVIRARKAGFSNISMDLMSALPGQTWDRLSVSLQKAISLGVTHLSVYSLIIEEGTPFHRRYLRGELTLPDEEAERELYWNTAQMLNEAGFEHYEISSFARPGFRCRHNENCWNHEEYLGFGASAAGYFHPHRWRNPAGLDDYLAGKAPEMEKVTPEGARFERLMLGLRLTEGVSLKSFREQFGLDVADAYPEALKVNLSRGLLECWEGRLRLTRRGTDLMDRVLLDFLP